MPTIVQVNLSSASEILAKRGLEPGGKAQSFFTNEVYRLSQPYTPFETGTLAGTTTIEADFIEYNVPYAHYQWMGISKNGKSFNYEGAPMRGREWTTRMWSDRGNEVVQSVAKMVGGKAE